MCDMCKYIMKKKKPKCESCYDKGYYTQMKGTIGSDDFGGEGFEVKPTIHKVPCPKCSIPESSEDKSGIGTMITPCSDCGRIYCENIVNGKCAMSIPPNDSNFVSKISKLRQWLNEDRITDTNKMVTNEELLVWFKDK